MKKNQTFTINSNSLNKLLDSNEDILNKFNNQEYLYIDGHLCFKNSKYIEYDINENKCLSTYALNHIDECCIIFSLKKEYDSEKNIEEFKYSIDYKIKF